MLKEIKAYELYCDKCGERFEGGEFTCWYDEGTALDEAINYDWDAHRDDGKAYCPDCH